MDLTAFFKDKTTSSKAKTEILKDWLLQQKIKPNDLINSEQKLNDASNATIMEAFEIYSQDKTIKIDPAIFSFAVIGLEAKAPRLKWESAKVIGNCCNQFINEIYKALPGLIRNSEHSGTVVRWSAAYAIQQIIYLKSSWNNELIPFAESKVLSEENNGVRKKYQEALKLINK